MFKRSRKDSSVPKLEGLEIEVQKDVLTMYGSPDESVGCILRGALKFHIVEPMKAKSISLKFHGKVKIQSGPKLQCQEVDLFQHKWTFIESEQDPYLLAPSYYHYNFELHLPGNLPESVQVPCGDISYALIAIVERPASRIGFQTDKKVNIQRAPLPFTDEHLQPIVTSGVWQQKLAYCISTPDTTYTINDTFPVMFSLLSLDPYLCMLKATVILREIVTCNPHSCKPIVRYHDLSRSSVLPNREQELVWEGSLNLEVSKHALYDCETEYIQVCHKFFVEIEAMEPTGQIQILQLQLKVGILSKLQSELAQSLPEYQPFTRFSGLPPPPYNFDFNSDYSQLLVV